LQKQTKQKKNEEEEEEKRESICHLVSFPFFFFVDNIIIVV
jgi:hypothetical protein